MMTSLRFIFIFLCIQFTVAGEPTESRGIGLSDIPEFALTLPDLKGVEPVLKQRLTEAWGILNSGDASYSDVVEITTLYHANGYGSRAEVLYSWIIDQADPGKSTAAMYYRLAKLIQEKGDSAKAKLYFEEAVREFADYPPLQVSLGEAKLKEHDLVAAADHFQRAISIQDRYPPAILGVARVQVSSGDEKAAISSLQDLLLYDKSNYNAKALLAGLLQREGEVEQAMALRLSISHSSAAPVADPWMEPVDEAILDPQLLDFRFLDYFMVGEYEIAVGYLERMEAVDPHNPRNFRYRGLYYLELGDVEHAERSLRAGLAINADDAELYQLLVKCLRQKGDLASAEKVAIEGIERIPGNPELQLEQAHLLFESGKPDSSIRLLEMLLANNPYSLEAHLLYARVASLAGKEAESERSLQMVLQLAPSDPNVLVRAALIDMESGRFRGAVPFLKQALSVAPGHAEAKETLADAYYEIGKLAFQSGEVDVAISHLSQSLEFKATNLDAQTYLVRMYLNQGRLSDAERSMQAFLREAGPHPLYLMMYGDLLVRAGKMPQAKEIWNRALASLNGDAQSQHLRKSLQQRLGR